MFKDRTVKDLATVTALKVTLIAVIYYACFSAYDGRPVDTATHLLGPAPSAAHDQSLINRGS
jgi:hypothetical protein